ncbi:2-oxo-hept-4-ene-1,7-dioate hydratase [Rhodobacter sp. 24-YEA-8]|uniref:2-oxo-hept-4-ene-1,7-dioate hydratase n=1 Tax=Rhodobacter sp. 24-YEA-8 TaxID=1884310 RepID=UPI00089C4FA5|nr:2-oxo-hepta-3-ene-1,7-dioic acid hydratase [Rhodobacter sp. 24-YEA-8]SED61807.1 2-oxohept-3-enedioate hydratase [Rhodobacter sp. 24-YEA-8]
MSLTETDLDQAARALYDAEISKQIIPQLSRSHPGLTLAESYEIQRRWMRHHLEAGRRVVGHKIGLTSRAMQMASKMTEPDYGALLDHMMFRDGQTIPAGRFIKPRLEVELAFILGEDLTGPGCNIYDVMRATEFVVPALEIIDYRTEVPRAITDTIADNAASGGVVVGGRPVRPFDIDIRWVGATLSKNAVIEESGVSAAIMGHPAAGVAWLANKLADQGEILRKGQFILGGSFTRPVDIAAGDVIQADYGPMGAISVRFE